MTRPVGPIILSRPEPRRQLRLVGVLFTFRQRDRTTGQTWWRESRTGRKRGDVRVSKVEGPIEPTRANLAPYAGHSGFDSVDEWLDAIEEIHGDGPGFLYRVTDRREE